MLTSPMGDPLDSRAWSSAPANLARALTDIGIDIVPFDSRAVGKTGKFAAALRNWACGLPPKDLSWFKPIRSIRSKAVFEAAKNACVVHILCTSSIDIPNRSTIPYSIWIDDMVHPLQQTPMSPIAYCRGCGRPFHE